MCGARMLLGFSLRMLAWPCSEILGSLPRVRRRLLEGSSDGTSTSSERRARLNESTISRLRTVYAFSNGVRNLYCVVIV